MRANQFGAVGRRHVPVATDAGQRASGPAVEVQEVARVCLEPTRKVELHQRADRRIDEHVGGHHARVDV
jgi:hypothetical protein